MHETLPYTEEEYDRQLDRLVDSRGCSYDDARRFLGQPPYELISTIGGSALNLMANRAVLDEAADCTGPFCSPLSREQRAINRRGLEQVRAVLAGVELDTSTLVSNNT